MRLGEQSQGSGGAYLIVRSQYVKPVEIEPAKAQRLAKLESAVSAHKQAFATGAIYGLAQFLPKDDAYGLQGLGNLFPAPLRVESGRVRLLGASLGIDSCHCRHRWRGNLSSP